MTTFINGLTVKKQDFNNGDYLFKVSIKFDDFMKEIDSYVNDRGYINIDICKAKSSDKWYARLNEWKANANDNK